MPVHLKFELRARLKEDGTQPVILRMTVGSRQARWTVGIYVLGKHWNHNSNPALENWISKKADDWAIVTPRLRNKLRQAEAAILKLEKDGKEITYESAKHYISEALVGKLGKEERSFLAFFLKQIEMIKVSQTEATAIKYQTVFNEITAYLKVQDLSFSELTLETVHKLEAFWLAKNKRNTVNKKLEQVKAMIGRAIDYGLIDGGRNPFLRYSFKWEKTHKERLTTSEVERIEALELSADDRLFDTRSVFLFQYYCAGMRIGDALCIRWVNVQGERMLYQMGKTGTIKSIKIPEQAQDIIAHYLPRKRLESDFVFPFMKPGLAPEFVRKHYKKATQSPITTVNKQLKDLAEKAGIAKNLTTHMARHTFADHAQRATGDVYAVSRALGHSTIGITEAYLAKLDEGAVDDTLDAVFAGKKKPGQKPGSFIKPGKKGR